MSVKNIKKYIENALVCFDIKSEIKKDALEEILEIAHKKGIEVDRDKVIENIYKKENIITSGIGYGVAFPHTYVDNIKDEIIIFATSKKGINYNSIDNKPVHLIIMFLTPKEQSNQYLSHISIFAKVSHYTMYVVKLLEADNEKDFKNELITLVESQ